MDSLHPSFQRNSAGPAIWNALMDEWQTKKEIGAGLAISEAHLKATLNRWVREGWVERREVTVNIDSPNSVSGKNHVAQFRIAPRKRETEVQEDTDSITDVRKLLEIHSVGDGLDDAELQRLTTALKNAQEALLVLGPRYEIARVDISRKLSDLESTAFHRKCNNVTYERTSDGRIFKSKS